MLIGEHKKTRTVTQIIQGLDIFWRVLWGETGEFCDIDAEKVGLSLENAFIFTSSHYLAGSTWVKRGDLPKYLNAALRFLASKTLHNVCT